MKKLILMALMCAVTSAQGGEPRERKWTFDANRKTNIAVVSDRHGEIAGEADMKKVRQAMELGKNGDLDQFRHMALNLVAAIVAGGGKREQTADPKIRVITIEDNRQSKANDVSLTVEHGHVFAIVRDAITPNEYKAELVENYPITALPKK